MKKKNTAIFVNLKKKVFQLFVNLLLLVLFAFCWTDEKQMKVESPFDRLCAVKFILSNTRFYIFCHYHSATSENGKICSLHTNV